MTSSIAEKYPANTPITSKGIALVVDDETVNRMILQALLQKSGYDVVQAKNGKEAIEIFTASSPDIIFMDVMMPEIDGYQAAREIKKLSGANFVPIIFLTAITSEEELAKCIEAGGDDFLTKPFSHTLLKARIEAIERVRDLHRTVKKQHEILLHDEEIAEAVFSEVVMAANVEMDKLQTILWPAVTFSGDIMMSERSPSGELFVLLGDFTGHGLVASIGALPASSIFRTMARKGFTLPSILTEMNSKLYQLLPADKFLALCAVSLSADMKTAYIWNGGLPDLMVVRHGEVRATFPANHLALGILDNIDDSTMAHVDLASDDNIFVLTDGVIEANNKQGEMYGLDRLITCIKQNNNKNVIHHIEEEINVFIGGQEQLDDISLVVIPCSAQLANEQVSRQKEKKTKAEESSSGTEITTTIEWEWQYRMNAAALKSVDPVPIVLSQLQDLFDVTAHRQNLFLILTELYVNALDHGVLKLDSQLKSNPDGFMEYMDNRENRLDTLTDGTIEFHISKLVSLKGKNILKIELTDSGNGFDFSRDHNEFESNVQMSGRGVKLIMEICESVQYHGCGNKVEVIYKL